MAEQADGRPPDGGRGPADPGERFTRRRFLGKAGLAGLAVGTGTLVAGCQFNYGPDHGQTPAQGSTSGQDATASPGDGARAARAAAA